MPYHALHRSPLRNVDSLLSATLIFVGANDEKVLPEPQGISLHRALSSRFVPTALYHYPGRMSLIGKIYRVKLVEALRVNHLIVFIYYLNYIAESNDLLSLEVLEHSFTKILLWLHENWGSYNDECLLTTTTTKSTEPGTTQDVTSIDNGTQNTSNVNYKTAACILLGMHFFTLIIWLHLKV